ncbi:Alpha-2-macroglobulin-like protein 1, partial [Lonchura striata]
MANSPVASGQPFSAKSGRYLIIIPAALPYPSSQRACLDLRGVEKPVRVALTLVHPSGNLSLYRKVVRSDWIFECTRFQVPRPAGSQEVATVHLSISNGHYFSASEEKKVLIRRAGTGTFIQMDKPIYNPGQTVKFRIVTLTEDFAPVNSKYSMVEIQVGVPDSSVGSGWRIASTADDCLFFPSLAPQDPNQNRIGQWLDVRPKQGIADLSFQLADELSLGTYTISAQSFRSSSVQSSTFKVEERVLQKFDVFFEGPAQIYASDKTFPLQVCGRYSFGKAVRGTVHVTLCQRARRWPQNASKDICREYSGPTASNGCFTPSVSTSIFNLTPSEEDNKLYAEASLLEMGTGVQINTSSQILISRTAARAVFETPNEYYIPGVPYRGKIKVQDHYGTGMKNRKVYLVIRVMRRRFIKTYITDDSGIASFNLDTTAWNSSSVSLEGRFTLEEFMRAPRRTDFSYTNAYHHLQPFHVTTKSFLDIHPPTETLPCGLKQNIQVTFTLSRDDLGEDTSRISFAYYVTGKSGIVVRGQRNIQIGKLNMLKGSFSIPLTFSADLSPSPSLVVYAIFPNGGVTADSIRLDVALCFQNQVKVGFPDKEVHAGSAVQLQLQAAPGSLCAVQAVDENMFFTRPDHELTRQMVYGLFPAAYQRGYPAQVEEHSDHCVQPQSLSSLQRGRPQHSFQPDIFNLFRNMGLKVFSNLVIKKPPQCSRRMDRKPVVATETAMFLCVSVCTYQVQLYSAGSCAYLYLNHCLLWKGCLLQKTKQSMRNNPNLQLTEDFTTISLKLGSGMCTLLGNSNGSRNVSVTAPAAAAEWKVKMFCLAGRGFSLAPTMSLRTVQSFFVDMTLPYSVIRGETFLMKATVFSYLQQCIEIQVALAKSSDFQVEPCQTCRDKECLCAEESKTFMWNVTAVQLGMAAKRDWVSEQSVNTVWLTFTGQDTEAMKTNNPKHLRPLLVKKSLLHLSTGNVAEEPVSLRLPNNAVKASARASISVTGDLMGMALQNLDHLVQLPHGCGEQNMVLFAPVVYVLQYLEKTRQLSPEIKDRATGFLRNGYQTQLLYKHTDGSYSFFGQKDGEGNTWLTAFVLKNFGQARKYIYVDDKNIQDALRWLEQNQLPSGCFATKGNFFHSSLKVKVGQAGSTAGEWLERFLTAEDSSISPLSEFGTCLLPTQGKLMQTTLHCLQKVVHNITNIYTEALLAYAFALAGDYETTQELLYKLEEQAIKSGAACWRGQIHWSPKPSSPASTDFWPGTQSVDIELTAYVLLAYLSKPRVHAGDMTTAAGIVAWLTRQQNAYGGFASTQDTAVALQALAKYAARTFSTSGQAVVRVRSPRALGKAFQVSRQKRLLVQQAALLEIPAQFLLQAHGSSCVSAQIMPGLSFLLLALTLQTVLRYHELSPRTPVIFTLRVSTELSNCSQANPRILTARILA